MASAPGWIKVRSSESLAIRNHKHTNCDVEGFRRADIDTGDRLAVPQQAGRRHRVTMAQSKYNNFHTLDSSRTGFRLINPPLELPSSGPQTNGKEPGLRVGLHPPTRQRILRLERPLSPRRD